MNTNILNSNIKELYLTKVSKEDAARKAALYVVDNPSISSALIDSIDWDTLDITYIPEYSYRLSWSANWVADIGKDYGSGDDKKTIWHRKSGVESGYETYSLHANSNRYSGNSVFSSSGGIVMGQAKRTISYSDNKYKFLEANVSEFEHGNTIERRVNNVAWSVCRNIVSKMGDRYQNLDVSSIHSINTREQAYVPYWELIFKEGEKEKGVSINAVTGNVGITHTNTWYHFISLLLFFTPIILAILFFIGMGWFPEETNEFLKTINKPDGIKPELVWTSIILMAIVGMPVAILMYPVIRMYRLIRYEKYINSKDLGFIRRFILWIYRSFKRLGKWIFGKIFSSKKEKTSAEPENKEAPTEVAQAVDSQPIEEENK